MGFGAHLRRAMRRRRIAKFWKEQVGSPYEELAAGHISGIESDSG